MIRRATPRRVLLIAALTLSVFVNFLTPTSSAQETICRALLV